ncbi:hypothetical protein HMPREF1552_00130 [Leptotrichia sp. oral taxon 879 str. F0557]|nr:hypothetical protein HMPREF1552_00130 [Leptotrichia sp. oral taxon 879 str. F0557]
MYFFFLNFFFIFLVYIFDNLILFYKKSCTFANKILLIIK